MSKTSDISGEDSDLLARVVETQRDIAAAGVDLERVLQAIVDRAAQLTGADGAVVSLIEGDEVIFKAACGVGAAVVGVRRKIADSIVGHAFAERDTLLIEHAESDPRLNPAILARLQDRSHICVPLFNGDEPVAALSVIGRSETRRLGERERQTLELLAVVLAAAVSRAAEFEARRQQVDALARFEATYASAITGMMLLGLDGTILDANPAMHDLLDIEPGALTGEPATVMIHPDDERQVRKAFFTVIHEDGDRLRHEHRVIRADGAVVWVDASVSLVRDAEGERSFGIVMVADITQRKLAEEALVHQSQVNEHQALHDALTGLPNRTLFRDRIGQALGAARRGGGQVAVLMMDLDRFKEINDSLGHAAGDSLLVELSRRLDQTLRGSDTVARLGGDEFGLLLPDAHVPDDVLAAVERVRHAVQQPVTVQGLPVAVDVSVGIALYPADGQDVETLVQHADVAMYQAKNDNSGHAFYDGAGDRRDPASLTLIGELRRALRERELVLHYQPKAVLADGSVKSVEALLRWQHPERGMIPPDTFIPVVQHTSLIGPLTLHVVEEALRQCRAWQAEGLDLAVAVNVSPRNLLDTDLAAKVGELLERWDVAPDRLEFEITESAMLADPVRTKAVVHALADMGIRLSIDDFGTGYSSLAYLKRLPVREIKIDRSFVMNMSEDADDATIVRSTIDLGRNLGLDVVAEGVESRAAWDRLSELGCTVAQGYFLSPPVPAAQLGAWLRDRATLTTRPA
jgi:diguanylate cyclase (GGDEF)-like protein/PAS domain S-box-containing protein